MGLLRVSSLSVVALLVGTLRCTSEHPTVGPDCVELCRHMKTCNLLPSALGTDQKDCEARCSATASAEERVGPSPSRLDGAAGETSTVLRAHQCVDGHINTLSWCSNGESPASCVVLKQCLLNQFANPDVIGKAVASLLITGAATRTNADERGRTRMNADEECPTDWRDGQPLGATDCEGWVLTPVGDLRELLKAAPDIECSAGAPVPIGEISPGLYEPKLKVVTGRQCHICSGYQQLAAANQKVTFVVPIEGIPNSGIDAPNENGGEGGVGGHSENPEFCLLQTPCESETEATCRDLIDNDDDGLVDCDDPMCAEWCAENPLPNAATGGHGGSGASTGGSTADGLLGGYGGVMENGK